jgi:hypothetical protein
MPGAEPSSALTSLLADRERRVWEAIRKRDIESLEALSAPDYISISNDGMLEWPAVVEHIRAGSMVSYELGEMTFRHLSAEIVAIAFKAKVTTTQNSGISTIEAAILSLWALRNDQWLSTFAHEIVFSRHSE